MGQNGSDQRGQRYENPKLASRNVVCSEETFPRVPEQVVPGEELKCERENEPDRPSDPRIARSAKADPREQQPGSSNHDHTEEHGANDVSPLITQTRDQQGLSKRAVEDGEQQDRQPAKGSSNKHKVLPRCA